MSALTSSTPRPTVKEQDALAVLRSGGSFADAMTTTQLTFEQVRAAWNRWSNGTGAPRAMQR